MDPNHDTAAQTDDALIRFALMTAELLLTGADERHGEEATRIDAVASLIATLYRIEGSLARIADQLDPMEND